MSISGFLKRLVVGDRSQDVDTLVRALRTRLTLDGEVRLEPMVAELMPAQRQGYALHQLAMAAQILVNRGEAVALDGDRKTDPVNADPRRIVLRVALKD